MGRPVLGEQLVCLCRLRRVDVDLRAAVVQGRVRGGLSELGVPSTAHLRAPVGAVGALERLPGAVAGARPSVVCDPRTRRLLRRATADVGRAGNADADGIRGLLGLDDQLLDAFAVVLVSLVDVLPRRRGGWRVQ